MIRIGHGYDVHRLVKGRPLVLGGVTIDYSHGLEGHSDADVLLHAVCDALLGAAGLGDIGLHFPDSDERFLGIDSRKLLAETVRLLTDTGYRAVNIDATLIAQQPKLRPYIGQMAEQIAAVIGLPPDCVNIKATTEEGLGFTGHREGIAAHCVCLISNE